MFNFIYNQLDYAHKLDAASNPTESYEKHIHVFNEILYLVRGNVDYTVEGETHHLEAGDLVFIPSGKYHFATVDSSVPYERYVLKFPNTHIPVYILNNLSEQGCFYKGMKKLQVQFQLLDEYDKTYSDREKHSLYLCETVKMLIALYHEKTADDLACDDIVKQIVEYVNVHIQESITMQTLTDEFHYSKSFLNSTFKKSMKIPVIQYIRAKKIMAAHEAILNGMGKTDAAFTYGFETYSTFYRLYKKMIAHPNQEDEDDE